MYYQKNSVYIKEKAGTQIIDSERTYEVYKQKSPRFDSYALQHEQEIRNNERRNREARVVYASWANYF